MRFSNFLSLSVFTLLLTLAMLLVPNLVLAQTNNIALANEYYRKGELEKAVALYEDLAKDDRQFNVIYQNYLNALMGLGDFKEAEKLAKRALRQNKNNPAYEINLGKVYQRSGKTEQATKQYEKTIADASLQMIPNLAAAFQMNELPDYAEKAYLQGRKMAKNETLYIPNLIGLYMQQRDIPKLIDEALTYASLNQGNLAYSQNMLQNTLQEDKEFDILEAALISRTQKQPNETAFPEMLIWLYTQKKDFFNALLQAKSLDRRLRSGGVRVMELGNISLKNKDYESAIEAFDYLAKEYRDGPFYAQARQRLINAREEQVKNTFPIDKEKIKALITEYDQYLAELGRSPETVEVMQSIAVLQAFYLDDKEKAIKMLEQVIATPRANANIVAQSKLHLGDIYLLKNEPWEATLLYSQVEKSHKETPIGHEAKLRNAKLNYYKGEFELAHEHLDILKMATSREIANDAMKLSILITDNMALDTTPYAMEDFARSELMLFQNKYLQSLSLLDSMLIRYPGHSITDEVYFQKAQIYHRMGDHQRAVENLNQIIDNYKQDILSDDALFMLATIYEENLNDKARAQELYTNILTKHPGSLFVVEARKRVRKLRGDVVN